MRQRKALAAAVAGFFLCAGCAAMERREWGSCALAGAALGAGEGAAGGLLATDDDDDDSARAAALTAGVFGGAIVGAVVGHLLCDPVPPPPTPTPVAAPPPPPPPPPPPTPAPGDKIATLEGPQFEFDKAEITPEGHALLDEAVRVMQENPGLNVAIEGHTDSLGSDAYNQRLSERRAAAVQRYLVSNGIDPMRMTQRGFGETNPIASNDTEEGRAKNRRVEIVAQ